MKENADRELSHPSAIQIHNKIFPVAFSKSKKDSSFIYFYKIEESTIDKIDPSPLVHNSHIGALAFNKIDGYYYIVGLGWDAKQLVVWKSKEKDSLSNFDKILEGDFGELVNDNTRNYNSAWLGQLDDSNEIYLLTTVGSFVNKKLNYLDVWKIDFIQKNVTIKLSKSIPFPIKTVHTNRSLFYEGVSIRKDANNKMKIIAAPYDYKVNRKDRKMKYLYEIDFDIKNFVE